MVTPILQRSFVAAGLTLQTEVLETAHKVIARVLHADREIFAVSLDRKFADSLHGRTLLGAARDWMSPLGRTFPALRPTTATGTRLCGNRLIW
jgi:hypothetical protein